MRHGRAKAARRTLQFFQRTEGFRPPYSILLDGTFIVTFCKYRIMDIHDRFDKLLQHVPFHFVTTQSSLDELNTLRDSTNVSGNREKSELLDRALAWAKQHCTRILTSSNGTEDRSEAKTAKDETEYNLDSAASRDILQWALMGTRESTTVPSSTTTTNSIKPKQQHSHHHVTKYFVASQDEQLLDALRHTGCVPVMRLARGSVLLLENPSKVASQQAKKDEKQKWTGATIVSKHERELVETVRRQHSKEREHRTHPSPHDTVAKDRSNDSGSNPVPVRRKSKAKGPNPLSCKRKKPDRDGTTTESNPKRKRRRKKTAATPSAESSSV